MPSPLRRARAATGPVGRLVALSLACAGAVLVPAPAGAAETAGLVPGQVQDLEVRLGYQGIALSWKNPLDLDWTATVVRAAVGHVPPANLTEGFLFYAGRREDATMNVARPGTTYALSVFTLDVENLLSAPVTRVVHGVVATVTAERPTIAYGSYGTLRGRLTDAVTGGAVGDREVEILCRRPGEIDWYYVGTANVRADGRFSRTVDPALTYDYWVFYRPEGSSDQGHGGAVAGPVRLTVAVDVTATVDRSSGPLGTSFKIGAHVGPSYAGSNVRLQRLVGGTWKPVDTSMLRSSSRATFKVTPTGRGTFNYRVYKSGDAERVAGVSRTIKIRVN